MELRISESDENGRDGVELWSYVQGYAEACDNAEWFELEEALTNELIDRSPSLEKLDAEINRIADEQAELWGDLRKAYLVAKATWLQLPDAVHNFSELDDLSTWEGWLAKYRPA